LFSRKASATTTILSTNGIAHIRHVIFTGNNLNILIVICVIISEQLHRFAGLGIGLARYDSLCSLVLLLHMYVLF